MIPIYVKPGIIKQVAYQKSLVSSVKLSVAKKLWTNDLAFPPLTCHGITQRNLTIAFQPAGYTLQILHAGSLLVLTFQGDKWFF